MGVVVVVVTAAHVFSRRRLMLRIVACSSRQSTSERASPASECQHSGRAVGGTAAAKWSRQGLSRLLSSHFRLRPSTRERCLESHGTNLFAVMRRGG